MRVTNLCSGMGSSPWVIQWERLSTVGCASACLAYVGNDADRRASIVGLERELSPDDRAVRA